MRIRPPPGRRTLRAKEIAAEIDVSPRTVIRMIRVGRIRALPGRPYRVFPEEVERFLMSRFEGGDRTA